MGGVRGNGSVPSLPPPRPKSPPAYPDLYGKRRESAKVQVLEREIGFLEEELKSIEGLHPASKSCKELLDFVTANPDPLIPTTKKTRKSRRFWKWLSCFNVSWICCCSCSSNLELPRCCSCQCSYACCDSCSNPCPNCCQMPKCDCDCFSCENCQCFSKCKCKCKCCSSCLDCCSGSNCSSCCCMRPKCPSCSSCSCTRCCTCCYPKCPNFNLCSCCHNACCYPCYFCY